MRSSTVSCSRRARRYLVVGRVRQTPPTKSDKARRTSGLTTRRESRRRDIHAGPTVMRSAHLSRAVHDCGDATGRHRPCPPCGALTVSPWAPLREATMTIRWNSFLRGSVLAVVALGLACSERSDPAAPGILADATAPSATQAMTYSARATVVQATVLGLAPITLGDAGSLPQSGGAQQ